MTIGILSGPILDNEAMRRLGSDAVSADLGDVLDATFEDAWTRNPGPSLWRWARRRDLFQTGSQITADDANARYGIGSDLKFSGPVYEAVAEDLHELKRAELRRRDVLARSPGGIGQTAAELATGFVASALDPVNIAASFLPIVGPARYAGMLEAAGSAGARAAVRARVGALEGAVGAALVEPIVYGVAQQEQADYGAVDSLLNLAFGTALGGGLHVVGGAVGDWRQPGRWRPPAEAAIDSRPFGAQEAAMRAAVSAVAEDQPVQADLPLAMAQPRRRRMRGGAAASDLGTVFDSEGRRIDIRYELTDLGRLITSNTDDFQLNPLYPAELQPRERDRVAGQAQITDIVAKFEPARLGRSPDASTGAPIVGADNVVESGNGRTLSLRRVYEQSPEARAQYQAWLVRQGYDIQGMEKPVLIARRLTELDPESRRRFTVAAQRSGTLTLSAAEQAMADARLLDGILHLHEGGDPGAAKNSRFVSSFIDRLPQADQGALATADGRLSRDGARRVEAALLARAFDDADLLGRMLETSDDGNRSMAGALLDVAPAWARMRAAVAAGEISPHVDATADLLDAVRLIRDARAAGRPLDQILAQMDAFDRPSPGTEAFLSLMLRGKSTAGRDAIGERLSRYVDEAMKSSSGPDLFGGAPPRTAEILQALQRQDPTGPLGDDLEAALRVERTLQEANAADATRPRAAVEREAETVDADLEGLRRAGLIGEEPELAEAARLEEDAAAMTRAIEQGAACMLRRIA